MRWRRRLKAVADALTPAEAAYLYAAPARAEHERILAEQKTAHRRTLGPIHKWETPRVYLLTDATAIRAQRVHSQGLGGGVHYVNGWTMRRSFKDGTWMRHERVGNVLLDTSNALAVWPSGPYPGDETPKQRCQCSWCTP